MRGFTIHAVVFAVVNALLIGIWLATTGTTDILNTAGSDPIGALRNGMWPIVVIALWGGALVIHLAVVLTGAPRRMRRRVRAAVRASHHQHHRSSGRPAPPAPPSSPSAPSGSGDPTARDLGIHMAKAAMGIVDNLTNKTDRPEEPPPPGRQLVTVMFTDLVGSTDLTEQLGDATWHRVLTDHRALVRETVEQHRGREVGTQGDGFLVRFDSPDAAVSCGVEIQRRMGANRASGAFTPELRVGIHAGEAVADDNDLVGRVINLASRVTGAAQPSEILVTEPVADHLSPGVALDDRGLVTLRGIAQARHLFCVDWTQDAPSARDAPTDPTAQLDEDPF